MKNRPTQVRRCVAVTSSLALGVMTFAVGLSGTAVADDTVVPSSDITIQVLTANGSGCPAGTATVRPKSDRTGFTVSYSDFEAAVGPSADPTDIRKNCQLSLLVTIPQGFTYAVSRAVYSGYLSLAAGASALNRTNYYLQGSSSNNYVDHTFSGPSTGRWSVTDTAAEPVYAPCSTQQILNVNTELRVSAGSSAANSTSQIAMTRSSGSVNSDYSFSWQKC